MTKAMEYAELRGEHFRLQISRGDFALMPGIKKKANALWATLTPEERADASELYFQVVRRIDKEVPK